MFLGESLKILFCSHLFAPSIGGIQTVSAILAEHFEEMGHQVTVVTSTPGVALEQSYRVIRNPSISALIGFAGDADIIFQNNISLRTLVPLLWARKPLVIAHHTWIRRADGRTGWQDIAKRILLKRSHNIAVSAAIAASLPIPSTVIGNPFEADEFAPFRNASRNRDVVFLGRLVSDKGCDLLLHALAQLRDEGVVASVTIIGDGPELGALEALSARLNLQDQIKFAGAITSGRGAMIAEHRVMVIPSRWAEPFGVVALEGLAAGCAVIASEVGGLPDAVGPCGVLFQSENVDSLACAIKKVLMSPDQNVQMRESVDTHLQRFAPGLIAEQYLTVFRSALSEE